MLYILYCFFELISLSLGSESCTGPLESASANQYECWDTNNILHQQFPQCVEREQRCDSEQWCDCPWCDDEWNCPTFDECQENGGFLCVDSYLADSNELWVCIPGEWQCDGIWDCPSGEDESAQFCDVSRCENNHNLTYWYQCSDTGRCIDIFAVGDGEIDCVNGEDESELVIMQTQNGLMHPQANEKQTTAGPKTDNSRNVPLYNIDLFMKIFGVNCVEACGAEGRFSALEQALASVFQLNAAQVSSFCQMEENGSLFERRRRWQDSLSSSSSSSSASVSVSLSSSDSEEESEEKNMPPRDFVEVVGHLKYDHKSSYLRTLHRILKHIKNVYKSEDSSSSSDEAFDRSIKKLNDEVKSQLSHILRKLVRVDILRVSGNA